MIRCILNETFSVLFLSQQRLLRWREQLMNREAEDDQQQVVCALRRYAVGALRGL